MTVPAPAALEGMPGIVLLVGRLFFGGIIASMGLNHFMQTDDLADYAGSQGVPAPRVGVLASGVMLVAGGLGIALGVYPAVAGGLIAVFLLVVTPTIHDFWTLEDESERQGEMVNFLKNLGLLGAAAAFGALSVVDWPYALNVGF